MKALLCLLVASCLAVSLRAQAPSSEYAPEQLDQMLGPIALYPDPLVALILPASTFPAQITQAAQFVAGNGDPSQIDAQPWDASVKGLAHYPDVIKWMNDNIDWTQTLGAAFAMQPADVMKSIQQLRTKAKAAGTLVDTPQQQVVVEGDDIRIIPAQPSTIYVPQYDPDAVYDVPEGGDAGSYITFDAGYPVGAWLGFECNWDDYGIWYGPWRPGWGYRRDWRDPHFGGGRWHPDARAGHMLVRNYYRPGGSLPRPNVIAGFRGGPGGGVVLRGGVGGVVRGPGSVVRGGAGFESRGSVTITHGGPDYRGYGGSPAARPSTPAPAAGQLYGGYNRGSRTRDYSNRGHTSRQAPVRGSQHSAPARSAPSHSEGGAPRR
jgi:hypothetical protein